MTRPADGGSRARTATPVDDVRCPDYPPELTSLVGVLAWQRDHLPSRVVCHRVARRRQGLVAAPLTVAELADRATRGAAHLAAAGARAGDRVILSLGDPHDFLVAFFAALASGATPVPLPTAGEAGAPRSFAARLRGVCASCAPRIAIVDGAAAFTRAVAGVPTPPRVLEVGALAPSVAAGTSSGRPAPADLVDRPGEAAAFIQYTSGSTGDPKGVVVTQRNALANCRAIRDATGYTRADRMVSWLPLHHDMGLVGGLLTSLYCAAETWLMPPIEFLARPVTWLEAISRYRATLTVAPTFAYSLCARKLPAKQLGEVDLSSLRLAYVGAEAVDAGTVDAFAARYAAHGLRPEAIYPVYGLAEATLAAAFPRPGAAVRRDRVDRARLAGDRLALPAADGAPGSAVFVSVGRALPRHRLAIVDPDTGAPLGERRVGEIVVEGESVSPRYFEQGASVARTRLHTGDLGYVAEGDLFVVDRIKDLVIVAGQNYAPSDIEAAAAEAPGVRRGRIVAFAAAAAAGREELHVVAEVSSEARGEPDEIAAGVREHVRAATGLTPASVTLVAPGSLERTSSGKIQRRACAAAHAAGRLAAIRNRADLRQQRWERRRDRLLLQGGRAARGALEWLAGALRDPS